MEIINHTFQRNGVSGLPFVHASVIWESAPLLLTIGYGEGDEEGLDYTTCRVINPADLTQRYRGDLAGIEFLKHYREEIA